MTFYGHHQMCAWNIYSSSYEVHEAVSKHLCPPTIFACIVKLALWSFHLTNQFSSKKNLALLCLQNTAIIRRCILKRISRILKIQTDQAYKKISIIHQGIHDHNLAYTCEHWDIFKDDEIFWHFKCYIWRQKIVLLEI